MIVIPKNAYPLTWPHGTRRTPPGERVESRFVRREKNVHGMRQNYNRTIADGVDKIRHELDLLGGINAVLSSDLSLRSDGLPYSDQRSSDPGVAIYWSRVEWRGTPGKESRTVTVPYCMPCDRFTRIADNFYAVGMSIEALRGMERWGCVSVEQAFAGFAALPPGSGESVNAAPVARPWREVLGVGPELAGLGGDDLLVIARSRHRKLIAEAHPDRGGDVVRAAEINAALEAAEREITGG